MASNPLIRIANIVYDAEEQDRIIKPVAIEILKRQAAGQGFNASAPRCAQNTTFLLLIRHSLNDQLFTFKHARHKEEQEVRVLLPCDIELPDGLQMRKRYKDGRQGETPFIPWHLGKLDNINPINEILLGPKNTKQPSVVAELLKEKFGNIEVKRSDLPYR